MMFHSFFTSSYESEDMPIKAVEDTNLMSTIMFIILARQNEKSALEETSGKEFHIILLHLKMFFPPWICPSRVMAGSMLQGTGSE